MRKSPIWATEDPEYFISFAVALFLILIYSYLESPVSKSLIDTIKNITSIGIFSITFTFFFTEGIGMFLKRIFKEEGRIEGREERDREVNQILDAALKEDPLPDAKELIRRVQESRKI